MQTIFLDESGYTGEHLLDAEQPIFALASHHISERSCEQLKRRFFGRVQARELKYSQLRRRPRQQRMVVEFIRELSANYQPAIKIYVVQKRYGLTAKIVDILIEKVVYAAGQNLYQMRPELLAPALYTITPVRCGDEFFQHLLERFADFVRTPSDETYEAFFGLVRGPQPQPLEQIFDLIRGCEAIFGRRLISRDELGNLDLAMPLAFSLANWWQMDLREPLQIIHDQTSNMAQYRELWDALVDPSVAEAIVGVGSRIASFPINVVETLLEPSPRWAGLQVADILAGAAAAATSVMLYGHADELFERELVDPVVALITQAMVPVPPGYQHPPGTVQPQSADVPEHMASILSSRRRT